jgi:hypothetical protein
MNRKQTIAILIAAVNLAIVMLFPPYDYVSVARDQVATFAGFHFVFSVGNYLTLNENFLALEVIVVLINACIALLVSRTLSGQSVAIAGNRKQRYLLAVIAFNLVMMLLFPPFENSMAITKATIPTLEGFFFIFGDNSQRQIVTQILYLEIALILVNGALIWLMLKERSTRVLSVDELREIARTVRPVRKP